MMDRRIFLATAASLLVTPRASKAQQAGKLFKIGILAVPEAPPPGSPFPTLFLDRLRELGYVDGRDVSVEYRFAAGNYDRLPELAADLVRARVDLIFVGG